MIGERDIVQVADPALGQLLEQIEAVRLDVHALTDGLTAEQFNWRPAPTRWSIGQCLEHVNLTVRLYPEPVEAMIRDARARHAQGGAPFREGLIARWIVSTMEPPPRMRIRTMRRVEPAQHLDRASVVSAFTAAHARLAALIVAADGVSLRHARMRSPFARLLWFTLGQVFVVNVAHARRHLWQARQVSQHPRFPA